MTKPPAFQFYARDWLSDREVRLMGPAGKGLYMDLLASQWLEGSIPDDSDKISALVGYPVDDLWPRVRSRFQGTTEDGEVFNIRLDEQKQEYERKRRLASKAGKASARARKRKSRGSQSQSGDRTDAATDVERPYQRMSNTAVATATAVTDNGSNEPADADVENSLEDGLKWNARLAPLAREAGGERKVADWLRTSKGNPEYYEKVLRGLVSLRDRAELDFVAQPGEKVSPAILSVTMEGQPIEKRAIAEFWRMENPPRSGGRGLGRIQA